MLALFIGGLLLSAVQGIQSQPSLPHIAESPQSNTNLLRWIQRSEEMLPVEGFRIPRIWLALGNRLAFRQIAQQMYEEPLGEKGLNAYRAVDGTTNGHGLTTADGSEFGPLSRERIPVAGFDEQPNLEKRDSYLSMCHFKLCNLGRKRRISQGGLTGLVPNILNADK